MSVDATTTVPIATEKPAPAPPITEDFQDDSW